jgi:CRISPR-associated protein (TIGR02710 family)
MFEGMILSVGGVTERLAEALQNASPDHVCWLASQRSVDEIPRIKAQFRDLTGSDATTSDHKILVKRVNQLQHCYQQSVQCARWVNDRVSDEDRVLVNYTGGTKTMSAALILASINHGYRFGFTGKDHSSPADDANRTPGKTTFLSDNPWDILAVREWDQISSYFNAYQFEACRKVIEGAQGHVSARQEHLLDTFGSIVDAYDAWDKFNHLHGYSMFEKAVRELKKLLDLDSAACLEPLLPHLCEHRSFLNELEEKTDHFETLDRDLLVDLYHNARRRIEEGKWADAAARLYRLVEMRGQLEVMNVFDETTSNFPPDKIPDALRQQFEERYKSERDGRIKLPLEPTYQLLYEHGNDLGNTFHGMRSGFQKIQRARNESILAHGTQPVREKHVQKLMNVTDELIDVEKEIEFPEIPRFECV